MDGGIRLLAGAENISLPFTLEGEETQCLNCRKSPTFPAPFFLSSHNYLIEGGGGGGKKIP